MRMKKRKRRKKISKNLILDFFAVPICIFFFIAVWLFFYICFCCLLHLSMSGQSHFYSPLCGFAMLCVVSPKLKSDFPFCCASLCASLFCRFILFAMNFIF